MTTEATSEDGARHVNIHLEAGDRTPTLDEQAQGRQLQTRFLVALFSDENWQAQYEGADVIFTISEQGIGAFMVVQTDDTDQEGTLFILLTRTVDGQSRCLIEQVREPNTENFTSAEARWDPDRMRFSQWVKDYWSGTEHKLYWFPYRGEERLGAWLEGDKVVAQLTSSGEFEIVEEKFSPEAALTFAVDRSALEGVELTPQEELMLDLYIEQGEFAARKEGISATLVATYGENGLGVYSIDDEGNFRSFVTREGKYSLEAVPLYEGNQPSWDPNERCFVSRNGQGGIIASWDPRAQEWPATTPPEDQPTPMPEEEWMRANGRIDIYSAPNEGAVDGYFISGQMFGLTENTQDGWIEVEVYGTGEIVWIREGSPYSPRGEPPSFTCPPESRQVPPGIGGYEHGFTEIVFTTADRFAPRSREFLGGRKEIYHGDVRITAVDLEGQTITIDSRSGSFAFRFSQETLFAIFNMASDRYSYADVCKFQINDLIRIHVESLTNGAFITGIWK